MVAGPLNQCRAPPGVKTIVLPKDNEKDLADIPKNVLDKLHLYLVETMDEVLKIALDGPPPAPRPAQNATVAKSSIR